VRLFRKSETKIAQAAAVQAEMERLRALSVADLAMALLPGLGPDVAGAGRHVRPQQLCEYLLREFPGAGQMKPLQLMAPVNRALEKLERAELVSSISYERSPRWRITRLGVSALTDGTTEQYMKTIG
jgi:hypothetical protein